MVESNDRQGLGEQHSEQKNKEVFSHIDPVQFLLPDIGLIPALTLAGPEMFQHEEALP